jgi:hypothetical protein
MSAQYCRAIGCRAALLDSELFCDRHWRMVPSDVQRLVLAARNPGREKAGRLTKRCEHWVLRAVDEILWVQTQGHRRPLDTRVEFTEEGEKP